MRKLPPSGTHGRPWSPARRGLTRLAAWVQARRQSRRPLMTVTAADLQMVWGAKSRFVVHVEIGGLAVWKFQSFRLRFRLLSEPGNWDDGGTLTNFDETLLQWLLAGLVEGEDYVFELTVTETCGVATVTEETVNVGFA